MSSGGSWYRSYTREALGLYGQQRPPVREEAVTVTSVVSPAPLVPGQLDAGPRIRTVQRSGAATGRVRSGVLLGLLAGEPTGPWTQRQEQHRQMQAYRRFAEEHDMEFCGWGEPFRSRAAEWLGRLAPELPIEHLVGLSSHLVGGGFGQAARPAGRLAFLTEPCWQTPGVTHEALLARSMACCSLLVTAGWTVELTTGPDTIYRPGRTVLLLLEPPVGRHTAFEPARWRQ